MKVREEVQLKLAEWREEDIAEKSAESEEDEEKDIVIDSARGMFDPQRIMNI